MAVYRKVFRIEERARTDAAGGASVHDAEIPPHWRELKTELRELRAMIESLVPIDPEVVYRAQSAQARSQAKPNDPVPAAIRHSQSNLDALISEVRKNHRIATVGRELKAIVDETEQATQLILQAAEEIEKAADMLRAAAANRHDRGLAQEIQDRVGQIFAACNFHDSTGQRANKVATVIKLAEQQVLRMLEILHGVGQFNSATGDPGHRSQLTGPKHAGEPGHLTQDEIDALFGYT
jgi:chemotaxis protein CheZ